MVYPVLKDDSINELIERALAQEVGNLHEIEKDDWELFLDSGIPQGGGISPLLANVYLHGFDKRMLSKGYGLVRYADDFVVLCKDIREAKDAHKDAVDIIEGELGLKLHEFSEDTTGKTKIIRPTQNKFEFLGTRFDGKYLYPGEKTLKNIRKRIADITTFKDHKSVYGVLREMKYTLEGWLASYCYTRVDSNIDSIQEYVSERVGVFAYHSGWLKRRGSLNEKQWKFSGLPIMKAFLSDRRQNLSEEEKKIFKIF